MDQASQIEFDRIVALDPEALTDAEKDVLRARRSYLTEEQRAKFASVLSEKPAKAGDDRAEAPAEETPRKAKSK